jgi:hypothetical protein
MRAEQSPSQHRTCPIPLCPHPRTARQMVHGFPWARNFDPRHDLTSTFDFHGQATSTFGTAVCGSYTLPVLIRFHPTHRARLRIRRPRGHQQCDPLGRLPWISCPQYACILSSSRLERPPSRTTRNLRSTPALPKLSRSPTVHLLPLPNHMTCKPHSTAKRQRQ